MSDLCRLIWCALIGLFRSRAALEAEVLVLRHQLNVLRRKSPKRLALRPIEAMRNIEEFVETVPQHHHLLFGHLTVTVAYTTTETIRSVLRRNSSTTA